MIKPGETLLVLVPQEDRLLVEVRVQPQDVDNVGFDQPAQVRLLAFKQRSTPLLEGLVAYISADAMRDQQSGQTHYVARVEVPREELARLERKRLHPGMPAEVLIATGSRTAVECLVQPILDSMNRAFREE